MIFCKPVLAVLGNTVFLGAAFRATDFTVLVGAGVLVVAAFFVWAVDGLPVAFASAEPSVMVTFLAAVLVAVAFFVLPVGCFFPAGAAAPLIFSMAKMQGFRIAKIAKLMCKSNTTDKKMKINPLGKK